MTKIEPEWIGSPAVMKLREMFASEEAYFVGGCVRNALIGAQATDLDVSSQLHPDRVIELANENGFKAIPTGIDHGTVTVVVEKTPFEITTFRKDVDTDGRHAEVAFAQTFKEDAQRRDFTMNGLYADFDGAVFDPVGGIEDLRAGRVRFIGEASERIREDYLRILRFFRFHAWYGDDRGGLDTNALAACAEGLDGLPNLSRERVGQEMLKLMSASDPAVAISAMSHTGVLATVLPGADAKTLTLLTGLEIVKDPIARLVALGVSDDVPDLRLSKAQQKKYLLLKSAIEVPVSIEEIAYREGAEMAQIVAGLRAAFFESPVPVDVVENTIAASHKTFPVSATDLMPDIQGAQLGRALKNAEAFWIAESFAPSRDILIDAIKSGRFDD